MLHLRAYDLWCYLKVEHGVIIDKDVVGHWIDACKHVSVMIRFSVLMPHLVMRVAWLAANCIAKQISRTSHLIAMLDPFTIHIVLRVCFLFIFPSDP